MHPPAHARAMRVLALLVPLLLVAAGAAAGAGPYRHVGKLPAGTWVAGTGHVYFVTLAEGDTLDLHLAWDETQGLLQAYVAPEPAACAPDDAACLARLAPSMAGLCGAAQTPPLAGPGARFRFLAPRSGEFAVWVAPVALAGLTSYVVTMDVNGEAPPVGRHSQAFSGGHAAPVCGLW